MGLAALLAALAAALLARGRRARSGDRARAPARGRFSPPRSGLIASVGFSYYVAHFSSYDATYGALGAIIVLLIWLYLGNLALLIGALVNRELRRVREKN